MTKNESGLIVTARKDWTCDWGTTGSSSTGCVGGGSYTVYSGGSTPTWEDWDVLRIDAGWCYRVRLAVPWKVWTVTYNRSGLSALYVKIEDIGIATVEAQRFGSCP